MYYGTSNVKTWTSWESPGGVGLNGLHCRQLRFPGARNSRGTRLSPQRGARAKPHAAAPASHGAWRVLRAVPAAAALGGQRPAEAQRVGHLGGDGCRSSR